MLVADHMTGFTLWDTAAHNYSITHTRYRGGGHDVVAAFVRSCAKFNITPGFFYSMHFNWFLGVDGYKVGHPPLGPREYTQAEYLEIAAGQMRELFGKYTPDGPGEIWFDGGTGPSNTTASAVVKAVAPHSICHSCKILPRNLPGSASARFA